MPTPSATLCVLRGSYFLWRRASARLALLALSVCLLSANSLLAADYEFDLRFPESTHAEPYTGRVYLFFTKNDKKEPRLGPDWFRPEPMIALEVKAWKPGEPLRIGTSSGDKLISFPKPLAELDLAGHRVQAIARFNPYEREVGRGPGNGFSAAAAVTAPQPGAAPQSLVIDQLVKDTPFPETKFCKLLRLRSSLLGDFHKRDVFQQASVLLPTSYFDQPDRRYPVIFTVPGFGGTHTFGALPNPVKETNAGGVEFIRVTLDPSCPLGHHVFADSANNGPVGTALVKELIPELDRQYRTVPEPTARFLTGHSSGGWSTLWLQVVYPEAFGGVWSTAPDPVDFRDFQRIDLYHAGENMYRDAKGDRRPLARIAGKVVLWYDDFDRMEETLGYGGQLHSFEAVFSPRGEDGRPLRAWNRSTGAVETAVAKAWEKYDIRLQLESRWPELAPKLAGKLHVIMGDQDTFYLEGATKLLKESLTKPGSDAVVELVPGKDHFSLYSQELLLRIRGEMTQAFLKHHPAPK